MPDDDFELPVLDEREMRRRKRQVLLDMVQKDPEIPEHVFQLLQELTMGLFRIETGEYPPEDKPTAVERKPTPQPFAGPSSAPELEVDPAPAILPRRRTKALDLRTSEIFDEAKKKK